MKANRFESRWSTRLFLCSLLGAATVKAAPVVDPPAVQTGPDPVVAIGDTREDPWSLEDCIGMALQGNDALRQQREGLAELSARKIQALAEGLPRLELQGSWSRSRDPSFALDESFSGGEDLGPSPFDSLFGEGFSFVPAPEDIPAQSFWRAYLDASWELRPTRVYRAVRAAGGAIAQQRARVRDLENRTIESVVDAFHSVVLAHERVEATQREVQARREFLEVTRRRLRLDFAAPLDTLQAAVSLANLRPELRRREHELRRAGQRLNLLLGRDPLAPLAVVPRFDVDDRGVDRQTALRWAARRPDLEAEQRQTDLFRLQRGAARAQNHPYLTLDGQWGYVGRDVGSLTDTGHDFWRAGVTVHVPLFDGLLTKGQVREAEAAIRRSEHREHELQAQVRDEVLAALDALEVARADLAAARLNLQRAEQAFEQIRLRYELGKAERLDVLDAQSERFTAQSTLIEARYRVATSSATLKRTMGLSPLLPFSALAHLDPDQENLR